MAPGEVSVQYWLIANWSRFICAAFHAGVWSQELESPGVRVLALSRSLSFEGDSDSDSRSCLSHWTLKSIWLLC